MFEEERVDVESLPGVKPRTTLVELISDDALVSDPAVGLMSDSELRVAVAMVEVDDSVTGWRDGEAMRGVDSSG